MNIPPAVEITPVTIAAIAQLHGLGTVTFAPFEHAGTSNSVYLLGEAFVLRVPRNDPLRVEGVAVEIVAVEAARAAGVRTPRIVAYDDSRELLPVPYAIYERVRGVALGTLATETRQAAHTWRALGHDLALLHGSVRKEDPAGRLPDNTTDPDPRPWLDHLVAASLVARDEERWLRGWLDRLEPFVRAPIAPRLCHGDVNVGNVMVDPGTLDYLALLDWGGAGWSDPAWDFVSVSLVAVPFILEGYRAVAPLEGDDTAEARIVWHHIQFLIFGLRHGPPRDRAWIAQRIARARNEVDAMQRAV